MDEEILIEDLRNKKTKHKKTNFFRNMFAWLWKKRQYVLLIIFIMIILIRPVETGTFIGKWATQEITKLEKELIPVYQEHSSAAVDWCFFKGKKIFTAWRKTNSDQLINVTKFDEMIYWIAYAVQHEKTWYADYQKNLS